MYFTTDELSDLYDALAEAVESIAHSKTLTEDYDADDIERMDAKQARWDVLRDRVGEVFRDRQEQDAFLQANSPNAGSREADDYPNESDHDRLFRETGVDLAQPFGPAKKKS